MSISHPIDLSKYRHQFWDEIDPLMEQFELNVVHPLADKILRATNPEYFNGEEVNEEYFDDHADDHINLVNQLGPTIFGRTLYKEFMMSRNGEGI